MLSAAAGQSFLYGGFPRTSTRRQSGANYCAAEAPGVESNAARRSPSSVTAAKSQGLEQMGVFVRRVMIRSLMLSAAAGQSFLYGGFPRTSTRRQSGANYCAAEAPGGESNAARRSPSS